MNAQEISRAYYLLSELMRLRQLAKVLPLESMERWNLSVDFFRVRNEFKRLTKAATPRSFAAEGETCTPK
jgi:hypothetical protein